MEEKKQKDRKLFKKNIENRVEKDNTVDMPTREETRLVSADINFKLTLIKNKLAIRKSEMKNKT